MDSLLDDAEQIVEALRSHGDVIDVRRHVDVKLPDVKVRVSDGQQLEGDLRLGQVIGLLDRLLLQAVVAGMRVVVASELQPHKTTCSCLTN